jgi:glycerophosphoryl diester phosphodiesterase
MMDVLLALAEKTVDSFYAFIPRNLPPTIDSEKAHIIAHRGAHNASQGIIENTHAAFRLAQQVGCWGIELDVQMTSDNVLVVNHDPTLNRLWAHNVAIAELSFMQLRALEPNIPSLAEVVTEYGEQLHLFIELKALFTAWDSLAQTLDKLIPCKDYHLISLDASLFSARLNFPQEALLLVAGQNNVGRYCKKSLKEHFGGVLGHYALFTNSKIKALKEANQITVVGYVASKYSLYRELNRGMYYLFTNDAVKVCHYLQQLRDTHK